MERELKSFLEFIVDLAEYSEDKQIEFDDDYIVKCKEVTFTIPTKDMDKFRNMANATWIVKGDK